MGEQQQRERRYRYLRKGDDVRITCSDEGYNGQLGKIVAVFASGRCQVAVGRIAILNLPPEALERIQNAEHGGES